MPSLRQRVAAFINPKTALSGDWFLNYLKIAADEDSSESVGMDNAFKKVAWLNIAVNARARNMARAPMKLWTGDTEIESGPVYDLFNYGLAGKTRYQLWEETEGWRCLRGEAIWILAWGGNVGFPRQIVLVDPNNMQAKVDDATRKVLVWFYVNGATKIPFKPEEVISFPMWNPDDPLRGISQFDAIRDEITQESLAAKSQAKLLNNSSIPGGVITIPGDMESADQAESVIERWEKKHRGASRAGRVAVLGSGATYQRISLTPDEMQSFQTRTWNRETILAKFGVPPAAVGLGKEGTPLSGTDTMEQMKAFWQITLIPELEYFQDKLKKDFFERFNLNMEAEFDLDGISELAVDEKELHDRLRLDVQAGIMTANEAREAIGYDPVPWGDVWWVPMSLTPADVSMENAYNPPEPEVIEVPVEGKPVEEEKPPTKMIQKGRPQLYTPEYRSKHWEGVVKSWESIESGYIKSLRAWVYNMRQEQLTLLADRYAMFTEGVHKDLIGDFMDDNMWLQYAQDLRKRSKPFLKKAIDETGDQLEILFTDLGVIKPSWNIWDTRAKDMLEMRVNKIARITDSVRKEVNSVIGDGLQYGWTEDEIADALRVKYNIFQNRAPTIARTELGGAINDSRVAGFKDAGFEKHEWLSAADELVRQPTAEHPNIPNHLIDGEIRELGSTFSNDLLYPNDPNGKPENVINCRCITLPVFGE